MLLGPTGEAGAYDLELRVGGHFNPLKKTFNANHLHVRLHYASTCQYLIAWLRFCIKSRPDGLDNLWRGLAKLCGPQTCKPCCSTPLLKAWRHVNLPSSLRLHAPRLRFCVPLPHMVKILSTQLEEDGPGSKLLAHEAQSSVLEEHGIEQAEECHGLPNLYIYK